MIWLTLFGNFQVTASTTSLALRLRPRAQRLLAYLLLRRSAPIARENLAFTLWPDSSEKESLSNLRRALNELRTALPAPDEGPEWIVAARGELHWNPDAPCWIDVDEFERLIRQATPATLHNAVALYTGDLLLEFEGEWVVLERERLRQMQLSALSQLVAHHRALGEYETALDLAQRLVALDPLTEIAHRELIALHYLAGDRMAALVAYEQLQATLLEALDVEPMTETKTLVAAIAQGAPIPADVLAPDPVQVTVAVPAVPRLIGREAEMAELGELWESAAAGHGRLAVVSGAAGVGKTHLVNNLSEYVARRGGLALVGHCYEFEQALPYQALAEMLRVAANLLPYAELPAAHRAALARIAPDVIGAIGAPSADETVEGESRTQMFEALLQAFLALARSQPLLVLLEDAHWASESTLDWLTYVAPRVADRRLLLAITYRTGEVNAGHALERLQRRFAREGAIAGLSLGPLSREANRELVAQMSGLADELAVPVADCLFVETAGNPFFLQEVARGLIEARQVVIEAGRWSGPFVEAAPEAQVPLPDTLRDTINARVARLTDMTEAFIRGAAAAGRVFEYEVVQQAGGWTEEMALEALEDLLEREFICQGEAAGAFAFSHHLVREAIYAELVAPRKIDWHRRIGAALEQLYPEDDAYLGDLAHHFYHGQAWEKAAGHAACAAERAEARYADDDAIRYYDQALDALGHLPAADPQQHINLLARRLRAEERQGDYERMTTSLAEMEAVARAADDDAVLADALLSRGHFLRMIGPLPEALIVLEECVSLSESIGRQDLLASALAERARVYLARLRDRDAVADIERALAIYREGDIPPGAQREIQHAVALRTIGNIYSQLGRSQAALDALDESLALLRALPEPRLDEVALTQLELGWALEVTGGMQRGLQILANALKTVRQIDLSGVMVEAHLLEMISRLGAGEGPQVETREAVHGLDRAGRWQSRPDVKSQRLALLAVYELLGGRPDLASPDVQQAIALWRQIGDLHNILLATWVSTLTHLALGQVEAALEVSAQGLDMLGEMESYSRTQIAFAHSRALEAAGRSDEARSYLEQAYKILTARLESLRDPDLREEAYSAPFIAPTLIAWKEAQGA